MRRKRDILMELQQFGAAFLKLEQKAPSSPEDQSLFPCLDNTGLRQERRVDTWRGDHRAWTSTLEGLMQRLNPCRFRWNSERLASYSLPCCTVSLFAAVRFTAHNKKSSPVNFPKKFSQISMQIAEHERSHGIGTYGRPWPSGLRRGMYLFCCLCA